MLTKPARTEAEEKALRERVIRLEWIALRNRRVSQATVAEARRDIEDPGERLEFWRRVYGIREAK